MQNTISRATLGRLPLYLSYLKTIESEYISSAAIAHELNLGDVLVRKDLSLVCGQGKPKLGFNRKGLVEALSKALEVGHSTPAVIVGAGKLGMALLDYSGFRDYGLEIIAAFDSDESKYTETFGQKPVYSMDGLKRFCLVHDVKLGIITVPEISAQLVCDALVGCGIEAIWNFSPLNLSVPERVTIRNENLALSLAHLHISQNH